MERFTGPIGLVLILGLVVVFCNNRRAISYRLAGFKLAIRLGLAGLDRKAPIGQRLFQELGERIIKVLDFSGAGSALLRRRPAHH